MTHSYGNDMLWGILFRCTLNVLHTRQQSGQSALKLDTTNAIRVQAVFDAPVKVEAAFDAFDAFDVFDAPHNLPADAASSPAAHVSATRCNTLQHTATRCSIL